MEGSAIAMGSYLLCEYFGFFVLFLLLKNYFVEILAFSPSPKIFWIRLCKQLERQ